MERTERIKSMEQRLDRASAAIRRMEMAMAEYAAVQTDICALSEYYFGPLWREDFEADERGELPVDLKRGVLSEDAVYDLVCDNDRLRRICLEKKTTEEQ